MWNLINTTKETDKKIFEKSTEAFDILLNREELGFFRIPKRKQLWESSQEHGSNLAKNYKRMAILGIGGSSLGARVLYEVFGKTGNIIKELLFFDNVDAVDFWKTIKNLDDLESICWVVISKSGGTIETLANANFISQYLKEKNIKFSDHATVISEFKDNPLTIWAKDHNIPILEIPVDVGGRFSVLTSVGLLPAAFMGVDLEKIRLGATESLEHRDLVCELTAQTLQSFVRNEWISVFWFYYNGFRWFGSWIQQLWAESLGKKEDRNGNIAPRVSTPLSCIGATDQHSILQQVAEGYKDKFIWFFRVQEAENYGDVLKESIFSNQKILENKNMGELFGAEAKATCDALFKNGINSLTLETKKISEIEIGFIFMLMSLVVGTLGDAMKINAFDQPGVELGKKLAKKILEGKFD